MRNKKRNIIGIVLVVCIGIVIVFMFNTQRKARYEKLGLVEYQKGNYREAIEYFSKGIEFNPDNASLYNNRGLAYYGLEQYNKAISDFTKAIELKSDFADAYYNRALVYTEQVHYHHKYKTISPKFPSEDMDNYNKALADYNKVLDLDSSYILAYQGMGNLFYRHDTL